MNTPSADAPGSGTSCAAYFFPGTGEVARATVQANTDEKTMRTLRVRMEDFCTTRGARQAARACARHGARGRRAAGARQARTDALRPNRHPGVSRPPPAPVTLFP